MVDDAGDQRRVRIMLDQNGNQSVPQEGAVDEKAGRVAALEQVVASQEAKISSL